MVTATRIVVATSGSQISEYTHGASIVDRAMRVQPILLVLVLGSCARRPAITPATTPPAVVSSQDNGTVAYRFIVDPSAAVSGQAKAKELVSPSPTSEFPLPKYPPEALAAHAGAAHVVVRILIDTAGRIANVTDTPVASSSTGPFAGEFRDSVLRALRHWRFTPGYFKVSEAGAGDKDGVRFEKVPVRYDVRFDFEIVGGEGRVRTSAPISRRTITRLGQATHVATI